MVDYKANPHSHFPYRADREMKGARALSLEGGGAGRRGAIYKFYKGNNKRTILKGGIFL